MTTPDYQSPARARLARRIARQRLSVELPQPPQRPAIRRREIVLWIIALVLTYAWLDGYSLRDEQVVEEAHAATAAMTHPLGGIGSATVEQGGRIRHYAPRDK